MYEVFILSIRDIFSPIAVAVIGYIFIDRLGEWRKRKMYSRLGVAIIESLQEEINTGIEILNEAIMSAESKDINSPPLKTMPNKSWNGMNTIPDDILIRIIQTTKERQFSEEFHPRKCRIHCKNYFEHMCLNYKQSLEFSIHQSQKGKNWREPLKAYLAYDADQYIQSANNVNQMLENAKILLEKNSRTILPK